MSHHRLRSLLKHGLLAAIAAAVLMTTVERPALAAPPPTNTTLAKTQAGQATDISAVRRHRRSYRGNAAGAAFMGAVLGTMGAIIAEQQRREYYERYYAPYPYGSYYYGRPYYGPRYYYPY